MVMNYQGVRQENEDKNLKPKLVREFMTKSLITFTANQTVDEVVNLIVYHSISGGPVVDEQNNLIGIISEGDCLKELLKGHYNNDLTMSAELKDFMHQEVTTVNADENIWDVANKFLNLKIRRFPVLENGKLVGQISQRDIMHAVQELKSVKKEK